MWAQFALPLDFASRDLDLLADLSEGFSGSDIQEVCRRLQRRKITGIASPEVVDAFQALQNVGIGEGAERRFLSSLRGRETNDVASALRDRNEKLYSHAALAQLLGISKATAYRKTLKKADSHGRRQKAG